MRPSSLRVQLLAWLLLPLAGVAVFNVWAGYRAARDTADLVMDRTLLGSARIIAEQVKETDGVIEALIPPSALEVFATESPDRVAYRVMGPEQDLLAGYPDVPLPPRPPNGLQPLYYEGLFRTAPIRLVAIAQPIVTPHSTPSALVVVGQTLNEHDRMVRALWLKTLRGQVLLVAAAGSLAAFGLHRGLAPMQRLRTTIAARGPDVLTPLDAGLVQRELRPVVLALNDALARVRAQLAAQQRFIANAAHQLRTPLALLKVQARLGLREAETAAKDDALRGIDTGLDGLIRMNAQLLSLARAEQDRVDVRRERVDLRPVCREVLGRFAAAAIERSIDLGLEAGERPAEVMGEATLLQEALSNLVENALQYVPPGGSVTAVLGGDEGRVMLRIEDTGPGIPEAERDRVFERFYRLSRPEAADHPGGRTGLGLAIVREIVRAHGGSVALHDRDAADAERPGLVVEVALPRAA